MFVRTSGTPKNANAQGMTSGDQTDWGIIHNGTRRQRLMNAKIPYHDHNGNTKFVVAGVYEILHKTLPSLLTKLPPPPVHPAYAIRDIPGKGKGLIATRDIIEGEVLIVERPAIIQPLTMFSPDYDNLHIYARDTMDSKDLNDFVHLTNALDKNLPEFVGIIYTNSFSVELKKGTWERYCAVFLETSRINHSCGPNLAGSWNLNLFTFSVQAVRRIRAGQELTIGYESLEESHADRRYDLERKYKFQCKCGYCTETSPDSDFERSIRGEREIKTVLETMYGGILDPKLSRVMNREKLEVYTDILIKGLVLVRKEGIEAMSALWYYVCLMKTYGLRGDEKRFKSWGFKAVLISVCYTDENGEEARLAVEQWIGWIKEPRTFPNWGKLQ